MTRWNEKDAQAWASARNWTCGFNFLPSTAVNFIEMWHRDSFDPATIERELGWAAGLGFTAFRINLHYLVWLHDRDGLLDRLDRVMGMADARGIETVPVLFDDCGFGGAEPEYGPQPDPEPGVHNSRAVASPGRARLLDESEWDGFLSYVRDIVGHFRTDPRVAFWDLYNEPGNRMIFRRDGADLHEPDFSGQSLALMRDSFAAARSVAPDQPLTVGAWSTPVAGATEAAYETEMDRTALEMSDILSFHAYLATSKVAAIIDKLDGHGRPVFCTEWMARPVASRIADQLALFRDRHVGCFQWGLVQGRTQTWLPWPADLVAAHGGEATRDVWFHDLLDRDGNPYDPHEVRALQAALPGRR
ncbi:cellulase family glycosylhydrolase [Rhodobacterales bacterium HKCCE3408]|nr:cellulase family glycosylhydrolase [Rhodobacterales bacterium HKCCE3408]